MDFAINIALNKFNNFSGIGGESIEELINRYVELYWIMVSLKITKTKEEWVNKLENALPGDEWRTYLSDWKTRYLEVSLGEFIDKIKERELELQKIRSEATDEAKCKSDENVREVEEQVKEISAIKLEKKAEDVKMTEKCSRCDKFESDNVKLLSDLDSLTLENKILKEKDSKVGESVKNASICFKCDNFKTDNDKLIKGAKILALEIKKLTDEKQADDKQILMIQEICEKLKVENDKLLGNLNSLTSENKVLKEKEKDFESKKKSSENEDFWIKLENKNLKANESKFQEQLKILEIEKSVLENLKNENENAIKSHLGRISQLEKEAENSRNKIDELEKKLIGFVTSSDSLKFPCPKPINSIPISDCVTNFDSVKVEDCDETPDDENVKKEKHKLFLNLKEKFQKTVLQSTEKGECSKQKPLKKKVEQKQKDNKSSSGQTTVLKRQIQQS
ncbi:hypothetical protein HanIR_Chr02g0080031 [Helianthus annuus]|nr:hypothetical protein HanIR_Chr02g0080031 [Helianthus annuus]